MPVEWAHFNFMLGYSGCWLMQIIDVCLIWISPNWSITTNISHVSYLAASNYYLTCNEIGARARQRMKTNKLMLCHIVWMNTFTYATGGIKNTTERREWERIESEISRNNVNKGNYKVKLVNMCTFHYGNWVIFGRDVKFWRKTVRVCR